MGLEEEVTRKFFNDRCAMCSISEEEVHLVMAHVQAQSKGGSTKVPLCPNCHSNYDRQRLDERQKKKLGLTKRRETLLRPRRGPKKAAVKITAKKPAVKKTVKKKISRKSANDIWW